MRNKSTVRIALICNMNNMFSALCKYLLDIGYDAYLFQYKSHPNHFDVKADTFGDVLNERVSTIEWTNPAELFSCPVKNIVDKFKEFDFIIGCGTSPAFLNKAGIKLDIFIPYGSDVYTYPFFHFTFNPLFLLKRLYFQYHQKTGIRNAKNFIMERQLDWVERRIESLGIQNRIYSSIPMVHFPTYNNVSNADISSLKYYNTYKEIRNNFDFVIFHHSRHSWKNPLDKFEMKGNDILFRGFCEFLKVKPTIRACIVTLEYGSEVKESKELIENLGISSNVFWLPLQYRKELMMGLSMCDLVVGELYNSFNLYGVVAEALQLAKPIMQKRIDSEFKDDYLNLHPIIYADSPETVKQGLLNFTKEPELYMKHGISGRKWYTENILNNFLDVINQLVEIKLQMNLQ